MSALPVAGNERIWNNPKKRRTVAGGETRAYESELHPRQPANDISVN